MKKRTEHRTEPGTVSLNEKTLFVLFDYQKFAGEPSLAALIDQAEHRYGAEIPDDELFGVSAAGETVPAKKPKDPWDGDL